MCCAILPGNPIMIVTEYMENGSMDTFLRVSRQMIDTFVCLLCKALCGVKF